MTSENEDYDNWRIRERVTSYSRFPTENEDLDNLRRINAARATRPPDQMIVRVHVPNPQKTTIKLIEVSLPEILNAIE